MLTSPKRTVADFSPAFETADYSTDFTSDSPASPLSPLSPLSPALSASASSTLFPVTPWDAPGLRLKQENLGGCPPLDIQDSSCPSQAINPMDLVCDLSSPSPLAAEFPHFQLDQDLQQRPQRQQQQQQQQQQQPAQKRQQHPAPPSSPAAPSKPRQERLTRPVKSKSTSADSSTSSTTSTTTTTRHSRRRGASPIAGPKSPSAARTPKKTAHNLIEKRYRTNLNEKINQLRDCVPSLRAMAAGRPASDGDDEAGCSGNNGAEDGAAATATATTMKLNKATILCKAAEYIGELERRNMSLETENWALRDRMRGLELLLFRSAAVGAVELPWA